MQAARKRKRGYRLALWICSLLLTIAAIFVGSRLLDYPSFRFGQPITALQTNSIYRENVLPGSSAWRITRPARNGEIAGYASEASVNRGGHLLFYVSVKAPRDAYTMRIFRLGYYSGAGARLLLTTPQLPGLTQGWWQDNWYTPNDGTTVQDCPTCIFDLVDAHGNHTHYIDANWQPTYALSLPTSWISGCYLVLLQTREGYQSYIPFVVRDDASTSDLLMKLNVATWAAYNEWGNHNLYGSWVNGQKNSDDRALEVSLNRPYATGDGAGDMLTWEVYMARFLEEHGYEVSYTTSMDISRNPAQLMRHKALIVAGHDEYWDANERNGVEGAIARGVSVAFFSGNESYFQVRYAPDTAGHPDRVVICYHDLYHHYDTLSGLQDPDYYTPATKSLDTTQWRLPPVNRPEDAMLGEMYIGNQVARNKAFPYVVSDAASWIYAGTSLRDGDSIPLIVGYEMDSVVHDGAEPASLRIVAASPVQNDDGTLGVANAAYYTGPCGNIVFAAGTIDWAWALDEHVRYPAPLAGTQPSWRLITITKNIVSRMFTSRPTCPANISSPASTKTSGPAATEPATGETPEP